MKKPQWSIPIFLMILFTVFLLGFFIGRNSAAGPITVSVPFVMQTKPPVTEETQTEILFPIDLNRATQEELMALPGIGETLALRILAYRRERGKISELTDLLQVDGFTQKKLDEIKDLVFLGG
ncbi:MAG: helix-hairpin-helix domain-containing protein [Oscillospiraceae bacterium]|nr:helix-hairpin-helix domain-containing protein [Oscillospiraceae bacterium]